MMTHIDLWSTLAAMVGLTPRPRGEWKDNKGKPIYFDSIDNSAYVLGKAKHSARKSWIYIDGEALGAAGWRFLLARFLRSEADGLGEEPRPRRGAIRCTLAPSATRPLREPHAGRPFPSGTQNASPKDYG